MDAARRVHRPLSDFGHRYRRPLTGIAATVFCVGLAAAALALDIDAAQVALPPLLVILFALAPLSLALSAVSLQLSAHALGLRIRFLPALSASSYAVVADLLPLPGGAVVRGAALVRAGASVAEGGVMVSVMAALTLSIRILPAGVALALWGSGYGWALVGAGAVGIVAMLGWLATRTTPAVVLGFLLVRIAMVGIGAMRIMAGFAALGAEIRPMEALTLTVAAPIGNAVTILPAGLGVAEGLAAALALILNLPASVAFIVAAGNRLVGLAIAGAAILAMHLLGASGNARDTS